MFRVELQLLLVGRGGWGILGREMFLPLSPFGLMNCLLWLNGQLQAHSHETDELPTWSSVKDDYLARGWVLQSETPGNVPAPASFGLKLFLAREEGKVPA